MSEKEINSYFTNTISQDLLNLVIGKCVSVGSTRTVFRSNDPANVVKFETASQRFQNILEWEIWQNVRHTKYKDWFAPCIDIGPCGTVLVQAFARDMEPSELPLEIPKFFADVKKDNFGMYNGHVVCRDYGNTWLIDNGLNNKMKKVEW